MNELRLSRGLLSAYYISILFSNLLFGLSFFRDMIFEGQDTVANFIKNSTNSQTTTSFVSWASLFIVCFLIVFIIKRYITEPLGFFIDDESSLARWEIISLFILVLGSFLYYLNIHFDQAMPSEIPPIISNLVDNQNSNNDYIPMLWNLGPMLFMFLTFRNRIQSTSKDEE